jgi:hypothetical protein
MKILIPARAEELIEGDNYLICDNYDTLRMASYRGLARHDDGSHWKGYLHFEYSNGQNMVMVDDLCYLKDHVFHTKVIG